MKNAVLILLTLLDISRQAQACAVCSHASFGPTTAMHAPRKQSHYFGVADVSLIMERRKPKKMYASNKRFLTIDSDDETVSHVNDDDDVTPSADNDNEMTAPSSTPSTDQMSTAMIATIGIYKEFVSPLLPPACRFLPTCSQYGVQAIQEFGPCAGSLLTVWRLLRCSPLGGKGYDPPKWPPVAYWYSSY
ncbi:hypothetical protein MPSEU_000382200 [Mayamaea pseudoterrestris]|nr:hypothetical protein MPSEU_000382200 [Mayamaea pseudoterrestris]